MTVCHAQINQKLLLDLTQTKFEIENYLQEQSKRQIPVM